MSRKIKFAKNVIFNWISIAIGMLVPFFLTPFVIHHLGKIVYGVWILIVSLIAYLNLLDFGLRGAIIRFVSKGYTQGNHKEALAAISTAMWMRIGIASGMFLIGCLFSVAFPRFFPLSPDLARTAQIVLIITALNAALTLVFGVFGAVLSSLSRFDLISLATVTQTAVRAAGIFVLLNRGHRLLSLALWDFCAAMTGNLLLLIFSLWAYPSLRRPVYSCDRAAVRQLCRYSLYVFLISIAAQVILYTDNLVVGAFAGAAAVAFYAIGGTCVEYARQIVSAISATFTPMASSFEAAGRLDQLQRLLIHGTRITLGVCLAVSITLFVRGGSFIALWIGKEYASVSGTVLRILIVSQVLAVANTTGGAIAYGMERHKPVAIWGICEAAANLGLSILLVRQLGLYGVAWGTTIAGLGINLIVWPLYISRIVQIPIRTYIWQGWGRMFMASLPYAFACYITERSWHANSLILFFLQIAAVLPVFALTVGLVFLKEIKLSMNKPWSVSA